MVQAESCCGDAFQQQELGDFFKKEETMNGAKYRQILEENLLQSAKDLRLLVKIYIPTGQ